MKYWLAAVSLLLIGGGCATTHGERVHDGEFSETVEPTERMEVVFSEAERYANGDSIRIAGIVRNSTSGDPISGVTMMVTGTEKGLALSRSGRFEMSGIEARPNTASDFLFVGYYSKNISIAEVLETQKRIW